jgi:DUF4097 and DUF4098 domain-containing protein YvlB
MRLLGIILCVVALGAAAQSKKLTETVTVSGQTQLDLEFTFADDIIFKTWDKNEVSVEVEVDINDGQYNDIFSLSSTTTSGTIRIAMDKDMWKQIEKEKKGNSNNCWSSKINYTVYAPKNMEIKANTISGNYLMTYTGSPIQLKTISGEIDMTIPTKSALDFKAKTISGEVFTDIEIEFPFGKDGLRQVVGQNVKGRIGSGGKESSLETISGNIYLRKG